MFNFTTTTLINKLLDISTGLPLWSLQTKTVDGKEKTTLNIKRLHNFDKDNVVAIYKAEGNAAQMAKINISLKGLDDVEQKDTLRLNLWVGLTLACQDARYSNDMYYKGKLFALDFVWKGTADQVAERLDKTMNKYLFSTYGEKLFDITHDGSSIVFTAKSEFLRFKVCNIEKIDQKANWGLGEVEVIKSIEDLTEVDDPKNVEEDTFFKGKEAFADYDYITRNLRLPTDAHTNAFAVNLAENPIPGALYNQYTIHYCARRGQLGLNAVGDVVKSVTTHVLFVNQDLLGKEPEGDVPEGWIKADIEAALEMIAPEEGIVTVPEEKTTSTTPEEP